MTKNEVRIRYKALRMALSKPEMETGSMAIANRVLQLPIWEKSYFHVFLPIAARFSENSSPWAAGAIATNVAKASISFDMNPPRSCPAGIIP